MRKLWGFGLLALLAMTATTVQAKDKVYTKVRIATEGAYAPFNFVTPDGKLAGFDVDVAMALCEQMKVPCTVVKQDWDGMIPALVAKKFDAVVASMSITDERKKKVDFTDKYYNTPSRVVRKVGSGIEISPEGLKGKKIGVQRETTHDKFVTATYPDSTIVRYATQDEANLDLVSGRVDVIQADSVVLSDGFLKTPQGKGFEFAGPVFTDPTFFGNGAGIAIRKGDDNLREAFNKAIAAIRADGTYEKIEKKYFDFDVYGKAAS